jgi:hypothetical protein
MLRRGEWKGMVRIIQRATGSGSQWRDVSGGASVKSGRKRSVREAMPPFSTDGTRTH